MSWVGLLFIVLAATIKIASGRLYLPELDPWTFPLWLMGTVWFLWGRRFAWWAAPSIAFLWFATPLPGTIEIAVSGPLQQLAANLSGFTLRLIGEPAITEGTTVLINEHVLDVERACSGLRMFYGIAALSVGTVALMRPALWKSVVILASAAPVAIFANVLRIVTTGVLIVHVSGEAAHKFSHDFAGIAMIPVGFGLFLLILWILQFFERKFEVRDGEVHSSGLRWSLGATLATFFLIGVIVWLGQEQKARVAVTLLEASQRFEAEKKWHEAIEYLNRYATAQPEDTGALIRLAEISRKAAQTRAGLLRAVDIHLRAWHANPERIDLLREAAAMAMEAQEFRRSIDLADEGLKRIDDATSKGEFVQLRADALQKFVTFDRASVQYDWLDVVEALEHAVELPRSPIRNYAGLAEAYRRTTSGNTEEARGKAAGILDRLVKERPRSSAAPLARFLYYQKYPSEIKLFGRDAHQADLDRAVELARENASREDIATLLTAAQQTASEGDVQQAKELLQFATKVAPEDHRAYVGLAELQRREEGPEALRKAEETLRQGIASAAENDITLLLPLASVLSAQGHFDEAKRQLDPIERVLPMLVETVRWPASLQVAMVQAEIAAAQGNTRAAVNGLNQALRTVEVRRLANADPQSFARAWMQLGNYYASLGESDQASEAYRQAGTFDRGRVEIKLRKAGYAVQAGDLDYAQQVYNEILAEDASNGDALVGLALVVLRQEMRRPPSARDWLRVQEVIEHASKSGGNPVAIALVQVSVLEAQGSLDQAADLLAQAVESNPDSLELWRGLVLVRQRNGEIKKAIEAADRVLVLSTNKEDALLLKANLHFADGKPQEGRKLLDNHLASAPSDRRSDAAVSLAKYLFQTGNSVDALKVLTETFDTVNHEKEQLAYILAENAWQRGEWDRLKKYEEWFRESEGPNGVWWRAARSRRLLKEATTISSPEFREAISLVSELEGLRPRWPQVHILRGELALRLNQTDVAIDAFKRAWREGGRDVILADRLLDLLTRRGRIDEANRFIGEVRDYLEVSERLFDRAIPYYARREQDNALNIAQDWANRDPGDPASHLRLGRVLMILAQSQEPEEKQATLARAASEFQAAIKLGPTDPNTWISAILFYKRDLKDRDKAFELLRDFANQTEIGALDRYWVVAQVYESEGMVSEACQFYHLTTELLEHGDATGGGDSKPITAATKSQLFARAAIFYLRFDLVLAERYAREAHRLAPEHVLARQALLNVLLQKDEEKAINEAFHLLPVEDPSASESLNANDRRLAAKFLLKRSGEGDFTRAISLLERSLEKTNHDRVLLAKLYEKQDRIANAWSLLNQIIASPEPREVDFIEFLRFWQDHFVAPHSMQHGEGPQFAHAAEQVYLRLSKTTAGLPEVLRWRVREARLKQTGNKLPRDQIKSIWDEVTANALQLSNPDDALPTVVGTHLKGRLFQVLIEEKEASFACEVALNAFDEAGTSDLELLATAFMSTKPEHPSHATAEPFFTSLSSGIHANARLMSLIADYFFLNGKYDRAVEFYRSAQAAGGQTHPIANNLSLALMESNDGAPDAWLNFEGAVASFGETNELLDTRAVLEIIGDQPEKAEETLETLLKKAPFDPVVRLHLAMAADATGKKEKSREQFSKAAALGLRTRWLSPRDREFVEQCEAKFTLD